MKKLVCASILALNVGASAMAQTEERSMVLSLQPQQLVMGTLAATYQYKINNYLALTLPVFGGTNWGVPCMMNTLSAFSGEKYESSLWFGGVGLGARFLLNNNGFNDGFFAEPRITAAYSTYNVKKAEANLIDSKRLTLSGTVVLGYSWFFNSGLYLSPGIEAGVGYHASNKTTIDPDLTARLKTQSMIKYMMWAEDGNWRPQVAGTLNVGYSW